MAIMNCDASSAPIKIQGYGFICQPNGVSFEVRGYNPPSENVLPPAWDPPAAGFAYPPTTVPSPQPENPLDFEDNDTEPDPE